MKKASSLWLLLALPLLAVGCGKDKSVEDHQREKLAENLARYQSVEGIYTGLVYASRDNEVMGAIALELRAETRANPGNGGDTSVGTPVLVGTIQFLDRTKVNVSAPEGYYDPTTGLYSADISVARPNDQGRSGGQGGQGGQGAAPNAAEIVKISGNLQGGTLNGRIAAQNYPELGGRFSLVRNGASVEDLMREIGRDRPGHGGGQAITREYVGTGKLDPKEKPRKMFLSVTRPMQNQATEFIERFIRVTERRLITSFIFSEHASASFSDVLWDIPSGSLDGQRENATHTSYVQCQGFSFTEQRDPFTCLYWTSRSGTIKMEFRPESSR